MCVRLYIKSPLTRHTWGSSEDRHAWRMFRLTGVRQTRRSALSGGRPAASPGPDHCPPVRRSLTAGHLYLGTP